MKKLFLILFSLSFLCSVAFADCTVVVGQTAASGGDCTTSVYSESGAITGTLDVKDSTARYYVGEIYQNAAQKDICAITFTLTAKDADVTANTYTASIWSISGGSLDTELGTSTGIQGNNSWSETAVKFSFSSSVTISATTDYAFLLTHNNTESTTTEVTMSYTAGSGTRCQVSNLDAISDTSGGMSITIWE